MNQILPLLLIAGAAYFFWPQIQSLLNPTATSATTPPVSPTAQYNPSHSAMVDLGTPLQAPPPGYTPPSILPQPGQYGISQTLQSGPVQPRVTLSAAYQALQANVVPPAVDVPPFGVVFGLPPATWNAYLKQLTGVTGPDLSLFPDPNAVLNLAQYWNVAMPALQSQGMSGLGWWYV